MSAIPTSITAQFNLSTANTTYRLTSNTVVSNVAAPFNVTAGGIIFDGSGFTITVNNTTNFRGLFNASLTVRNVDVVSAGLTNLSVGSGTFFGSNINGGIARNCKNYVDIAVAAGGIFGSNGANGLAINCSNFGTNAPSAGGIFGFNSFRCVASNCLGRAPNRGGDGGSIIGRDANECSAINCVSSDGGTIPAYAAGIYGFRSTNCTAINCINTTNIGGNANNELAAGIMAYNNGGTVSNCYNTGTCLSPGGSFAILTGSTTSNCYTTNGAIGGTPVNCSSNSDGVWNDATATASRNGGNGLTGTPFYNPDATTSAIFPSVGSVWYSTGINTPFLLSATIPPCFVAGTRILTPTGYKCVEILKDHDEVVTSDGRTVSIKVYKTTIETTDEDTAPYVIPKDAFGLNNPDEDLHVSGKHVIRDGCGKWQIPMHLLAARQYGVGSPITYYHIECPDYFHDDLVANGAVVESFRNNQGTSELSYTWNEELRGYTRIMEESLIYTNLLEVNV